MGKGKILTQLIESRRLVSLIFWGLPARENDLVTMLAWHFDLPSTFFSAVLSGIKEVKGGDGPGRKPQAPLREADVDHLHRRNPSLHQGPARASCPMSSAATSSSSAQRPENPSFEVIAPLLSRTRVLDVEPLDDEAVSRILDDAPADPDRGIGRRGLSSIRRPAGCSSTNPTGDAGGSSTPKSAADLAGSGVIGPDHVREAQQVAHGRCTTRTGRSITTRSPPCTRACETATSTRLFTGSPGCSAPGRILVHRPPDSASRRGRRPGRSPGPGGDAGPRKPTSSWDRRKGTRPWPRRSSIWPLRRRAPALDEAFGKVRKDVEERPYEPVPKASGTPSPL